MRFSVYQVSRKGGREKNEDRMGYCYTRDSGLFALADGMGGRAAGEVASSLAVQTLVEAVGEAGLPRWLVFAAIALLYIVLGMFIDSISMMVMTLPVLFPLVVATGFDPIWFGVVLVILIEIGLITPPVGVNLFVLKGLGHDVSMRDIVLGVVPFAAVMLVVLVLLYLVPGIATWLPETMAG